MVTSRQKLILKAIVEEYVKTCEPVGSKSLIENPKYHLDFSSATIRNEMAVLEELGFLLKTHTSSGRIPSEEGYKLYVTEIINDRELNSIDDNVYNFPEIDEIIERNMLSREEAIKESMAKVSELTNYASIVLDPRGHNARIKKLQFVSISGRNAVILMVTDSGNVESRKIVVPESISIDEIEKIISFLNELLYDCPISEIDNRIKESMNNNELRDFINYYDQLTAAFIRTFTMMAKDDYVISGERGMFTMPEFQDLNKVQEMMSAIEKEDVIRSIVNQVDKNGVMVRIGKENTINAMKDCTVITVPYETSDGALGTIAVLGPTRMEYQKIIPLLEYIAKNIKNIN